jgi:hypothetical protein
MRLIDTSTLKLETFHGSVPIFVILSHTWGEGEVSFDDIDKSYAQHMLGYRKIQACCRQARNDGFEYLWIDTCCIDKKYADAVAFRFLCSRSCRSSADLSENINSMWRYYKEVKLCYAYLTDVWSNEDPSRAGSSFLRSRWVCIYDQNRLR